MVTKEMRRAARIVLPALLLACLLSLPGAGSAFADLGGFTIDGFHTDIKVLADSRIVVTERIEVDFSMSRHGIYRTIPVRYTDPRSYMYSLGFKLLEVTDERGLSRQTQQSRDGPYVKLRIGDPDDTVMGREVYVIRYEVRDALRHFSEHDELYWNAIGDEWQTTISEASATVYLPEPIETGSLQVSGYSGPFGTHVNEVSIDTSTPGEITYRANESLGPFEGLTVVAGWPHGYVDFPSRATRLLWILIDNWILAVPFVAAGLMYYRYRKVGRDPEGPGALVVRYEPPEGMGPGGIGTIVDEDVDMTDITAVIVDLAVRGYLTIGVEEEKRLFWTSDVTVFERLPDKDTSGLLEHERLVLDGLFESGDRVTTDDLREEFYTHLPDIRDAIYKRLVDEGYFASDPETQRLGYSALGFVVGIAVFAIGVLWALLRGGIMPLVMIGPAIAGVATATILLAFAPAMPRRTVAGVKMRSWALGFQEFVDRVEADRLERAEAQNAFETLLPYAMALGVAAKWARKFEGIYEEGTSPAWFVGPYAVSSFSTTSFETSLSTAMAGAATSMAQTPRSSGSSGVGGGGFSGGGFGGGGGGSW